MKAAEDASVATTESYTRPALDRLLDIALEISSEEARCAADFLLWWYDADAYGAINIKAVQARGPSIRHDIVLVFAWVINTPGLSPKALGYGEQFERIAQIWRPQDGRRNAIQTQPVRCE
jgi:hypothetical protein